MRLTVGDPPLAPSSIGGAGVGMIEPSQDRSPAAFLSRMTRTPVPRLAFSPDEAAASLGVSRDYFDEHVLPELRTVRRGRRRLVPIRDLERWLSESAARALESER